MTDKKAPERIWAAPPDIFDGVSIWQDAPDPPGNFPAYIRDDLHLAMVAAALSEWSTLRDETEGLTGYHMNGSVAYWSEFDLPEAPDDARAALDRLIAEAVEREREALTDAVKGMQAEAYDNMMDTPVRAALVSGMRDVVAAIRARKSPPAGED